MSELKLVKQLINDTPFKYGRNNGKKFIVVHQTGNTNKGANAQMHANLQSNGNSRDAAWHYTADDKQVIQSFSHGFQLWQAGDGEGDGNLNGIAVEICVNKDGKYKKSLKNAAKLINKIIEEENINVGYVKQHHYFSGKNCPRELRAKKKGISWNKFIKMIENVETNVVVDKEPEKKPASKQYKGNSVVDYLNSIGSDAGYSNRAKLAKEYGIKGYKGTAKQNKKLLKLLRKGKPSKPAKKGDMKTGSIVTYLRSIDVNSSYSNRAKLASKHGIKGYKGSASQNTRLLDALRGDKPKKSSGGLPNAVYRADKPYPKGSGVRKVQEALAKVYYYPNKGAKNNGVDGVYGPNTADAVKRYQSQHGLNPDGVYGPKTRAKLI